mgnify:CR=1 FL=1
MISPFSQVSQIPSRYKQESSLSVAFSSKLHALLSLQPNLSLVSLYITSTCRPIHNILSELDRIRGAVSTRLEGVVPGVRTRNRREIATQTTVQIRCGDGSAAYFAQLRVAKVGLLGLGRSAPGKLICISSIV